MSSPGRQVKPPLPVRRISSEVDDEGEVLVHLAVMVPQNGDLAPQPPDVPGEWGWQLCALHNGSYIFGTTFPAVLGMIVPAFDPDAAGDDVGNAAALVSHARRMQMALNVSLKSDSLSAKQMLQLKTPEAVEEWTGDVPVALLSTDYRPHNPDGFDLPIGLSEAGMPGDNLIVLDPTSVREYLLSLARAGLISLFEPFDPFAQAGGVR